MTSCRLAYSSWHFEVVCCLHLQDSTRRVSSAEILGKDRVGEWNSEPLEVVVLWYKALGGMCRDTLWKQVGCCSSESL